MCGDDEENHYTWCGRYSIVNRRDDYQVRYAPDWYWADFPEYLLTRHLHKDGTKAGSTYALEHRLVAWEKYGSGPQRCVWCDCALHWAFRDPDPDCRPTTVQVDHLDGDRFNNDPDNLVVSCSRCNTARLHRVLRYKLRHDPDARENWELMATWAVDKETFSCGCPFEEGNILVFRNGRHQGLKCKHHERERLRVQNAARRHQPVEIER